ncbi:MAG TPA: pilus assembly protein TadG-related protein, partial [Reyranella sp.]
MIAILAAVPVLVGTVAVGVETGQLYRTKRQMQSAADAAALAGSVDRMAGKNSSVIQTTAQYEAQRNGFTNGVNSVAVTVNSPPTSGPNMSTTSAVEVTITKTQGFTLGAVLSSWLGITTSNFTMRSRSVAAQGNVTSTSQEGCLVALTPNNEQGVSFTSFNNFNSDCTIVSNGTSTSSNSSASVYIASFNNATVKNVWTRGSFYKSGYNSFTTTDQDGPKTNQTTSVIDPYASLPTPTIGTCSYDNFSASSASS